MSRGACQAPFSHKHIRAPCLLSMSQIMPGSPAVGATALEEWLESSAYTCGAVRLQVQGPGRGQEREAGAGKGGGQGCPAAGIRGGAGWRPVCGLVPCLPVTR